MYKWIKSGKFLSGLLIGALLVFVGMSMFGASHAMGQAVGMGVGLGITGLGMAFIGADLYSNISIVSAFTYQQVAGAVTVAGTTIDLLGYGAAVFCVQAATVTLQTVSAKLYQGNAANMSDEEEVSADDLVGTLPSFATTDDNAVKFVGLLPYKRYARIKLTGSAAGTDGYFAGTCIKASKSHLPAST